MNNNILQVFHNLTFNDYIYFYSESTDSSSSYSSLVDSSYYIKSKNI